MPKRRRTKGKFGKPKQGTYDSDDERAYQDMKQPDPESREYMYDEVDEFHANKEKILLDDPGDLAPADSSSDEEEVFGLQQDDDDDEEVADMSSDELEGQDDEKIPNAKAWGKKKSVFYNTDYVDDDLPGVSGSEEEDAQNEEEREALALQQRMAETLEDEDFGMELFKSQAKPVTETPSTKDQEKVIKDLTKLSKREKLELLKKESPELLELIEDFKMKLREVIDKLQPLMNFVKEGRIGGKGATYVQTKFQLYLNYCINISFYMILKSRHTPVHNHPVIKRLVAFRNLIKQLEPLDKQLEGEIDSLLNGDKNVAQTENIDVPSVKKSVKIAVKKKMKKEKKKLSELSDKDAVEKTANVKKDKKKRKATEGTFTADELEALNYYTEMKKLAKERKLNKDVEDRESHEIPAEEAIEETEESKRAITYEISKNKGLTPKRKKLYRNPRVKHREKFRKAKIRRKGQVREVRRETERYGGEVSGIRAGVIKSIKLKT